MPTQTPTTIPQPYEVLNWVLSYTRTAAGVTYGAIQEQFLGSNPSEEDVHTLKALVDPLRNHARVVVKIKPTYRSTNWTNNGCLNEIQRRVLNYVRELTEEVGGSCIGQEVIPFEVEGREEAQRALEELTEINAISRTYEEIWKILDPLVDFRGEISG